MLLCLIVLVWGLDKGFDTNVEGYYMLSYQRPELYEQFTQFHLLLSKLPKLSSSAIMHYRWLEVLARLIPSVSLAVCFSIWAQTRIKLSTVQIVLLSAFAALGGMVSFTGFPRTISYNGLVYALIVSSCAFTFAGTSSVARTVRSRTILLLLAGVCAGLTLFVKFTSFAIIVPVLLAFVYRQTRTARHVLSFLSGMIASVVAFFSFVQTPAAWWNATYESTVYELG
ncbi:MAG: hypothetical protein ACRD3W_12835, partial [Terriglobales bacterium]